MPTYEVKSRTTGPTTIEEVEAETSQEAIIKTVEACEEGSTVEVMQVTEIAPDPNLAPAPQAKKEK